MTEPAHNSHPPVSGQVPAVIYAAKSTEDKHGSIPDQLADGRNLAVHKSLNLVAEFDDEAASAYHGDRGAGLAAAIALCERLSAEHGSSALIVQHSDRLARGDAKQARHLIEVVVWAIKHDVQLLSVQDPEMLAGGDMALLMGAIGGMRNHQDSKRKGAAVKGGIRRRAVGRRQFVGGRRPYGYRHRDRVEGGGTTGPLVIVEAEAAVVRRIFRDWLEGVSQRQIAIALNNEGAATLTGGTWYATTVAGMLRNPLYAGWVNHNGESYPAVGPDGEPTHAPIIDAATWEHACRLREALAESPGRGRGRRTRGSHLLTDGLLRCTCGSPMSPVTKPTKTPGRLYETYVCARRLHHGPSACGQRPIKRHRVDGAVWDYFQRVALDVEATKRAIVERLDSRQAEIRRHVIDAQRQATTADGDLARVRRDYMRGVLPAADWIDMRDELTSEATAARAALTRLEDQRQAVEQEAVEIDADGAVLAELTALRAQIVGELQDRSQTGSAALRTTLTRTFEAFHLRDATARPSNPFDAIGELPRNAWDPHSPSFGPDGPPEEWSPPDHGVTIDGGYFLIPAVRSEAIYRTPGAGRGVGYPVVEPVVLPFSDNLRARLAAW